jgi:nitrogen fixation/metabolism regulation signal transduction histidine kinase
VKSQLQDGQLRLSVGDTRVSLSKEKMDQIFSAFLTTKPQGIGMWVGHYPFHRGGARRVVMGESQ